MPNLYCPSCGLGIKYLYQKPAKCDKCNYVFSSISTEDFSKTKRTVKTSLSEYNDEDEDLEESDEFEDKKFVSSSTHRKFKKIKPSLDLGSSSFEKVGEVIGSDPNAKREKRKSVSKEDFKNKIFSKMETDIENV